MILAASFAGYISETADLPQPQYIERFVKGKTPN